MTERERIISHCDALIDTYHAGVDIETLLTLRRDLAVHLYRLSAFVHDTHGKAGLSYVRRKFATAREIVAATSADAKLPMNKAEVKTEALATVNEARTEEVWAEADREALKAKIDAIKQVLQAQQQDIAHAGYEQRTTHHQNEHA